MPAFVITIQGKTYHVEIPDPGAVPLKVIVDGEVFEVALAGTQAGPTTPPIAEPPRPVPEPAPLPPLPRVAVARPAVPAGANGGHDVTSPMPGTILSIEVTPGQSVAVGQVLCVLEAMKMKNPIRATVEATVAEILVQPGQAVAYGDVLMKLGQSD